MLWRSSFTIAAVAGAIGFVILGVSLREIPRYRILIYVLWWVAIPIYLLIAVVAAWEGLPDALDLRLSPIEIEGLLLTLLVFLGIQAAWVVAMAPREDEPAG